MFRSFLSGLLPRTPQPQSSKAQQNARDAAEATASKAGIEATLSDLCATPQTDRHGQRQPIPSGRFKMIAVFVRALDEDSDRQGAKCWHLRPRLFTVLRGIGALIYMDHFVKAGIYDVSLPFDRHNLPEFFRHAGLRQKFLAFQDYVLTDARKLESGWADEHIHFAAESADDHFHIQRKLGSGGFGSVDAVYSRLSGRFYARKVYHREKDAKRQQFITKEIELMKTFSHRHLTRIIGSYTDPDYIAYLMEPVADFNLLQYLKWLGGLSTDEVEREAVSLRQYFGCLAGAIDYLHANRVRHRDIKPQNILIKDQKVYVADFGAAVEWTQKSRRGTTQSYNAPRSPEYMAPEIHDRHPRNAASDMWSLGIVFLEMLTVLKGQTLGKWKDHLKRKSSAQAESWPCRNLDALNEWMSILQARHDSHESDNEPLMWIKELVQHRPEKRYTSESLVKVIRDSSYCHDFVCYDCTRDFTDSSHIHNDANERTIDGARQSRVAYEHQIADLLQSTRPPLQHMDDARAEAIDAWVRTTTEYLPMSVSSIPGDALVDGMLREDANAADHNHNLTLTAETSGHSEWETGDTAFWEPLTTMPGAFIDDEPISNHMVIVNNNRPPATETRPEERGSSSSDGDMFEVVRDSSTNNDTDSISVGRAAGSVASEAVQDLQTIVEETAVEEVIATPITSSTMPTLSENRLVSPTERLDHSLGHRLSDSVPEVLDDKVPQEPAPSLGLVAEGVSHLEIQVDDGVLQDATLPLGLLDVSDNENGVNDQVEEATTLPLESLAQDISKNENDVNDQFQPATTLPLGFIAELSDREDDVDCPEPTSERQIEARHETPNALGIIDAGPTLEGVSGSNNNPCVQQDGSLHSPPQTPDNRVKAFPFLGTHADGRSPPSQWPTEPPPPYSTYPSPPTSPQNGSDHNSGHIVFPTHGMPHDEVENPWQEQVSQDATRPSQQPSSSQGGQEPNRRREKRKQPEEKPVAAFSPPQVLPSPRRSFNPSEFSPVQYIEEAWREMEKVQSLATSVMSEGTAKRLRGPLLKKFDHDYAYMESYAQKGSSAAVKHLIDRGCNPGTRQKPRPKPLLLAIKGASDRHNKCVRALIRAGCDVNARFRKKTPIHWAIDCPYFDGYLRLVALLLGAGAEMNTPDGEGDYPLLKLLAGKPDEPLEPYRVKALALILHPHVLSAVDVNVRQAVSLNTALHIAIQRRTPVAVAVLLHHGADVNAENASSTTPLLMAAAQWRGSITLEQEMILSFLLQNGQLKIDVKGGSLERTALQYAVAAGCVTASAMLLERGASPSQRDKKFMNAWEILESVREKVGEEAFEEIREALRWHRG